MGQEGAQVLVIFRPIPILKLYQLNHLWDNEWKENIKISLTLQYQTYWLIASSIRPFQSTIHLTADDYDNEMTRNMNILTYTKLCQTYLKFWDLILDEYDNEGNNEWHEW